MKNLELFKEGFDSTLTDKVKVENWPFVGHDSVTGEVVYTELPVTSEILYTTIDGELLRIFEHLINNGPFCLTNVPVISNTYSNNVGKIVFSGIIEDLGYCYWNDGASHYRTDGFFGGMYIEGDLSSVGPQPSKIKSVILPNTIKTINGAFISCSNLESITFNGTQEEWNNIDKPDFVIHGTGLTRKWNHFVPATVIHCSDGDLPI